MKNKKMIITKIAEIYQIIKNKQKKIHLKIIYKNKNN